MSYLESRVLEIPEGHAGIEATVRTMRRVARRGARTPLLQRTANRIMATTGTPLERARRIRDWLEEHTRFEWDPEGVEFIRTPRHMVQTIRDRGVGVGDCDDVAVLAAALSHVAGLPSRFVLLGFTPGQPYEHVYLEIFAGGRWIEVDPTRPAQFPAGLTIHRRGTRET